GTRDVGEAMPDVADTVLARDLGLDVLLAKDGGNAPRDLTHGVRLSTTNVVDVAGRIVGLEREATGARDVVHAHEIPALLAILENRRRMLIEEPRGENGEHAGIGIRECLTRSVDVEETERDSWYAVRAADHQTHALLIEFRKCVHRGERRTLRLRC